MLRTAFLALGFRLALMTTPFFGNSPYFILLLQLTHGISFAMGWIAAVEKYQFFAAETQHEGGAEVAVTATAQSIVTALYFTVGQVSESESVKRASTHTTNQSIKIIGCRQLAMVKAL